jgi:hypothetical protein
MKICARWLLLPKVPLMHLLTLSGLDHAHEDHLIDPVPPVGGALAFVQAHAVQATALASAAAQDAADVDISLSSLQDNHCKIFLIRVFGINPDGTPILDNTLLPDRIKTYHSVKTVQQHQEMVRILTKWRDDEFLKSAPEDDLEATEIKRFRCANT